MSKIFILMGKSASGKDTIYQKLLEELDFQKVVPYTTRPIRSGEVDGETYHFCDDEKVCELQATGRVIEMRSYDTMHGVWKYFTADDGQIDMDAGNSYLMIGTLESYGKIRNYFGVDKVFPIYIHVDDGLRLSRALERERAQKEPKYAELCRRFLADEEDFSKERLEGLGIGKVFENECLEDTIKNIILYITRICM